MSIKITIFICLVGISLSRVLAQENRQIAITIDDLPTLSHGILNDHEQAAYFERILHILGQYKIKATGFVSGHLIRNENKSLMDHFVKEGHQIGNHTYMHYDLNKTSADKYCSDIERCQLVIKEYVKDKKYFRYPMLHRGMDASKKDSVLNFLKTNQYTIAPVSIDTDEADYNLRYVKAYQNRDTFLMATIGEEYIEHMISQSIYYDSLAIVVNKKPIKHILLLHMNFINSVYLNELLTWYKNQEWEFIDLDNALKDPFYTRKDNYLGKKGLSFIERVD